MQNKANPKDNLETAFLKANKIDTTVDNISLEDQFNFDGSLNMIFDNISEHIVMQDTDGKVLYANKSAADAVNATQKELLGRICYKIWNKEKHRCKNCPIERALKTKKNEEEIILTKDNRYWHIKGIPIKNGNGEIVKMLEITKEVTREHKAAIELEKTHQRNEIILSSLPDFLFILDGKGKILDVHTSIEEDLFAPKNKVIGKNVKQILPVRVSEKISKYIDKVASTKETQQFSYKLRINKQDNYYDARMLMIEDGRIIAIVKDITARRMAEKALEMTEKRFQELANLLPQTIFEIDIHGNFVYTNEHGYKHTGYTPKDIEKGLDIFQLTIPEEHKKLKNNISRLTKRKKIVPHEYTLRKKNGDTFPVYTYTSPIYYNNKLIGYRGIMVDITEIKESQLLMVKAKDKAEESDRLKTAFLENMSHEIRTPLNGIMGLSELLKEKKIQEEDKRRYVDIILERGQHLLNVINDIIDISKIESGQIDYKPKVFSINNMMDKLYTQFNLLRRNNKSNIEFTLEKGPKNKKDRIYSDPYMLEQILFNLLTNAFKYTNKGTIVLGYKKNEKNNTLEFYVKDTGMGVAKEKQKLIFDRFRQADEGKTKSYGGTGLGLTISKKLVDIMGGDITIESQQKKGSIFIFTIPFNAFSDTDPVINNKKSISKNLNWEKKRILIVEDDPSSFFYLKAALKKTNANILHATDGLTAIDICKANNVDLILMDIQLPKLDGLSATKKIRTFNKDVPIIIETAYAMKEDKRRSIDAGGNDYISKPFERKKLLSIISKYI